MILRSRGEEVRMVPAVVLFALTLSSGASAQSSLEEAKRAYFEGRFEASLRSLEALLRSLSDPAELRDAAFFAGLNQLALGNEREGRSYFESAVRHDPGFEPPEDLFNPSVIGLYRDVRSSLVGSLQVESTPAGAEVFVGGRMVGKTPYRGPLLSGEQLVRLELAGHSTEERRVRVRPGDDESLTVQLRPLATTSTAPAATTSTSGGGGGSGKTIGIVAGAGGGAAALLALAGGGGESSSPSRTATTTSAPVAASRASYSISITPSPIPAQPSTEPDFDWLIRFTVTIVESSGLGGNVDFVNAVLRDGATGAILPGVNFGAQDVISRAGTNRVEARSQLQIPLGVVYNVSGGSSAGTLTVDAQLTDDRGNVQRLSANALIR
jgi:hypothetical protein